MRPDGCLSGVIGIGADRPNAGILPIVSDLSACRTLTTLQVSKSGSTLYMRTLAFISRWLIDYGGLLTYGKSARLYVYVNQ